MELWDIIDEKGNLTGRTIKRGQSLNEGDFHLVVHIWIINDANEFFIQKRASHLKLLPDIWAATSGSVISGEDSLSAAIRETKEEIGVVLNPTTMRVLKRVKRKNSLTDVWVAKQTFSIENVQLLKTEVSDAKWVTQSTLKQMLNNKTFFDYGEEYFKEIWKL